MSTATAVKSALDPQIQADWVAALRSGDYEQGRGTLRSEDGYCCLGVLADVIRKSHPEILVDAGIVIEDVALEEAHSPKGMAIRLDSFPVGTGNRGSLGPLAPALGIYSFGLLNNHDELTRQNDVLCKTFEQIADVIETVGLKARVDA